MIEPGIGSAELKLGLAEEDLGSILGGSEFEDRGEFNLFKNSAVWFFFRKSDGKLIQLTFFDPCNEKVLEKVGIGDTLRDVKDHFGKYVVNDRVVEPAEYSGIAFTTVGSSLAMSAVIETISVSEPFAQSAELARRIRQRQLMSQRRLP